MHNLVDFLSRQDVEYIRNPKMSQYSSIAIGGRAKMLIFPDSKEKLIGVFNFLVENSVKFKLIGNLTNLLLSDDEMDTVFVSTIRFREVRINENIITAECGALFTSIINQALKRSVGGCEQLFGIPGTVGAMISMNAGAYGLTVSDYLLEVQIYDPFAAENRVRSIKREEIAFFYRDSELKRRSLFVLEAKFKFSFLPKETIKENIAKYRKKRIESQPVSLPSLGSVFKRSDKLPASYMIDRCGLKGLCVGGISVSEKHAGFFVNIGMGTAKDFKELAKIVKSSVSEQFGVELYEEVEYF